MGLSSKKVCSDGLDNWKNNTSLLQPAPLKRQHHQLNLHQQSEPLNCPRCDSTNTKFCYYNNYNESQPRHFCRACKRHWTKGGTLRNVPVGGVRKKKRPRKTTAAAATDASNRLSNHISGQEKILPEILYQGQIRPPSFVFNGNYVGSTQNQSLNIPFSSSISYESKEFPILTSVNSSDHLYNYGGDQLKAACEEPIRTSFIEATTSTIANTGQVDMSNYWNWDDISTFVATDLNLPWDDSDLKL